MTAPRQSELQFLDTAKGWVPRQVERSAVDVAARPPRGAAAGQIRIRRSLRNRSLHQYHPKRAAGTTATNTNSQGSSPQRRRGRLIRNPRREEAVGRVPGVFPKTMFTDGSTGGSVDIGGATSAASAYGRINAASYAAFLSGESRQSLAAATSFNSFWDCARADRSETTAGAPFADPPRSE